MPVASPATTLWGITITGAPMRVFWPFLFLNRRPGGCWPLALGHSSSDLDGAILSRNDSVKAQKRLAPISQASARQMVAKQDRTALQPVFNHGAADATTTKGSRKEREGYEEKMCSARTPNTATETVALPIYFPPPNVGLKPRGF